MPLGARFQLLHLYVGSMADRDPTGSPSAAGPSCGGVSDAPNTVSGGEQTERLLAENAELRTQLEQLRHERGRWIESQRRIMELLGTSAPERIPHDLRNLLNERDLLKTLVDQM